MFTQEDFPLHFLDWYAYIVTLTALIYICWGGIQYINSNGKPGEILEARRTITYAIQGYVWMLFVRLLLGGYFS
jgi:TRAP-type C4-dicarboxylate transport system permease small subunit